jgi:ParD-like antitoxin of type II bacterial toxin-antitoxin system
MRDVVICHIRMSSNSIRISAELFEQAQRQGEVLSRSAAQQVEHWARLGAALEQSGLSVGELVELLRGDQAARKGSEQALWAAKRAQQARDIAAIEAGRASNESMSWFSGGRARRAKAIKSPL